MCGVSTVTGTTMPRFSAYSMASIRVIDQSRAGASTVSCGLRARIAVSRRAAAAASAAPCATVVVCSIAGDFDQLSREDGAGQRRHERPAIVGQRVGLDRPGHPIAGELLADVEDVCAHGSGGERAIADFLEFAGLPEVQRDRDDVGVVGLGEPGNGDRRVEPSREGEHDAAAGPTGIHSDE